MTRYASKRVFGKRSHECFVYTTRMTVRVGEMFKLNGIKKRQYRVNLFGIPMFKMDLLKTLILVDNVR